MNGSTWILVADAARAKLYSTYKAKLFLPEASEKDLHLLECYEHPESRKLDKDLVSGNLGRFGASESGINTYEPASTPKQIEEDRFAMELIKVLHDHHNHNKFEELILIASPPFMGMLNTHIAKSNGLKSSSIKTIEKDYIELSDRELVKQIAKFL